MKYSIGLDFGTLSGRALLVELETGKEIATSVFDYPHAVMSKQLDCGVELPADFALQHPQDYLDVLSHVIPDVLKQASVSASDVVGVGVDFTACTVLPVLEDGTPLCFLPEFENRPHSYVKLWKHHAAQDQADILNAVAAESDEAWLKRYGGKISSEWIFPKIMETLKKDEEVYNRAARFVEGTDWLVWQLTGTETHSSGTAGYKAIWHKKEGFPAPEFFEKLDPRMKNIIGTKISDKITSLGDRAGEISPLASQLTGLAVGTPVAIGNMDAHVALPAVGITKPGKMLMIMGTSTCHIVMGEKERDVPGICGVVEDGVVPGYFGYEAGQCCCGDHFAWFVKNCVPAEYTEQAERQGVSIHKILREKAQKLKVGESGLLALDFWNGNRSTLVDSDLTGMMLGMNLETRPEEIYRALIEATAYGTRIIIENYEEHGVPIHELYAAGGIAAKDEMMMQIYADVTGKEIRLSGSSQAPALGSAMFGAVAGGYFDNIDDCAKVLAKVKDTVYRPIPENSRTYDKLYAEYKILYNYFGKENNCMKRLKKVRDNA